MQLDTQRRQTATTAATTVLIIPKWIAPSHTQPAASRCCSMGIRCRTEATDSKSMSHTTIEGGGSTISSLPLSIPPASDTTTPHGSMAIE